MCGRLHVPALPSSSYDCLPAPRAISPSPHTDPSRPAAPRHTLAPASSCAGGAGERYAEALAASERWVAESGAAVIHAFDQLETMLGQGTVALELSSQASALDTLLVAVGCGGLIGGIAAWYAGKINVVGVEPE